MSEVSVIRLGVAGLGWLGESLIKDVPRVPGLEVAAVQDVLGDRAREIAARYDIAWSGTRFDALLALEHLNALVICTPNALHATQAQAALRAGKDVLVQKPLALSHADAQATVDAAAAGGHVLFVDYTYRFLETMRSFRDAMGAVGQVRSAGATFHNLYGPGADKAWFFDSQMAGGGALMDLGVHLLDLALWLVAPGKVALDHVELSDVHPVDHAARLRLSLDAVPFELAVSWNAPVPATEIAFDVVGSEHRLRWENVDGSFFHFRTLRDDVVLADRETTLREDTLRAFAAALESRSPPFVDTRVYALLDRAYGRDGEAVEYHPSRSRMP